MVGVVTWKCFLAGPERGEPPFPCVQCTFPELENLSKTSFIFFAQITTKNVPLVLLAQSAYFPVSSALLRWEVGEYLAEPVLLVR